MSHQCNIVCSSDVCETHQATTFLFPITSITTWWTDDCGILDSIAISVHVICLFLQYGSHNGCWYVFSISSQLTTLCLVFSIVLTLTKPLGPMQNCVVMYCWVLVHFLQHFINFCGLWQCRVANLMSDAWSSIVIWPDAILSSVLNGSTQRVNDLLHFKYINEESKVLTTNQSNINCTGVWSEKCMHGVHCLWDYPCKK